MSLNRIEVLHGVNLNMLGQREPDIYGTFTLDDINYAIDGYARDLGFEINHFQSNFEGEYVERLHNIRGVCDGAILNPGSWTHYSWAIHDALRLIEVPAVEVHISDVAKREEWRQFSVISDLCIATISGKGREGYREALEILREKLG